jgi:hydrogenase/urease accessory protein HupE
MLVINLSRLAYLFMEAFIIGGVAFVLWAFHFRFLWQRRWVILLGTLIVTAYALPLDAVAVAHGWGGFNPAYVSGAQHSRQHDRAAIHYHYDVGNEFYALWLDRNM